MKRLIFSVIFGVICFGVQGMNALRDSVSDVLQTENGLLPSLKLYEYNEKIVNAIYLATLSKGTDTFTVSQKYTLEDIANQCPLSGGEGVYYARSLVRLYDDSTDYDDKALCFAQGINYRQVKDNEIETIAKFYPNPAQNTLSIEWKKEDYVACKVEIRNILGVVVYNCPISFKNNISTLDLSNIPSGIYQISLLNANQTIASEKLSIIH